MIFCANDSVCLMEGKSGLVEELLSIMLIQSMVGMTWAIMATVPWEKKSVTSLYI